MNSIKSSLSKLKKFAKDHPYVALGLTAAGAILFNRESEEDCIETCTGSPDDDWKKAHSVTDTYSNHCPEPDCQAFCSASGTGQCSASKRNAASANQIGTELLEDAGNVGGDALDMLKDFFLGPLEDNWLPIAVCCGIMFLSFFGVIVFKIVRTKTTNKINTMLNSNSAKYLKQVISPNAVGGGIKNRLNSPKLIILLVFFIFIVYNGRR